MQRITARTTALVLALLGTTVLATSQSEAPSGPRVVLQGLAGEPTTRALLGFETTDPRQQAAHVLRFEGVPPASVAKGETAIIELAGGERLVGPLQRASDEALYVGLAADVRAKAGLEDMRSIQFRSRIPANWAAPLERAKEGDRIYRRKNDTIERMDGGVEAFGETSLKFHDDRIGSLDVAWTELVALFVDSGNGERAHDKPQAVQVVVDLVGKTRLRGSLSKIDSQGVALERRGGETLRIPPGLVSLVLVDDGKVVFLSDLEPREAIPSAPFGDDLGLRWPHRADASVMDTPLTAGGRVFSRGIGVHAPSRIVWALDGTYESLRGMCAVDDSVLKLAAHGSVKFRVIVDGAKRFESKIVRGGDAPVPIVLEPKGLAGAKEIVLEVDVAEDSFVADRADWLQVMLVKGVEAK